MALPQGSSPDGVQVGQLRQLAAAVVIKPGAADVQLCQAHQGRQPAKLASKHLHSWSSKGGQEEQVM